MADTSEKVNIIAVPPDTSPLVPESENEQKKEEAPIAEPSHDDLRLPDVLARPAYNTEPEATPYRWAILASYALAVVISSAMASFYNSIGVLLVDVPLLLHPT